MMGLMGICNDLTLALVSSIWLGHLLLILCFRSPALITMSHHLNLGDIMHIFTILMCNHCMEEIQ